MLKSLLRQLRVGAVCLPWRASAALGFPIKAGAPVQFVVEKADWAIRWVGEHIRDEIEILSPGMVDTTTQPEKLANSVVHFGSQYMWLNWGRHLSQSNQFIVSFFHGKPEDGPEVERHIEDFLRSISRITRVITAASIVERRLLNWGVPRDKLVRIPIGVDTKNFNLPKINARSAARRHLGIPDHAVLIGSFQKDGLGWGDGMVPKLIKGPDVFVDAMATLKAKGLPVMALLTGPARGYVKRGLDSFEIPYVHTYAKNHIDLVSCYHALDLYLVTSREEGGPMGLMESMASGVPVVSTSVGMAPDLIRDALTGGLITSISGEEIAEKAIQILNSDDLNQIKMSAREAVTTADWSNVGRDHWRKVYEPALSYR